MNEIITLSRNNPKIQYLCKKDKRICKVIDIIGPISYCRRDSDEAYQFFIHEIIEQMLSIKAGNAIYNRLHELCEGNIHPDIINNLSDDQLRSIGTSKSKVSFIRSLTDIVISGDLDFESLSNMDDAQIIQQLTSIHGIGIWTSKMYLLFFLGRENILPYEDVAFLQAYQWLYKTSDRSSAAVIKKCKKWSPYSSIAARYLYRALDTGLTHEEFHLYK